MTSYDAFLRDKVNFTRTFGFDVPVDELHPALLPHQRAIVRWALAGGRRAIFAKFGTGKSIKQLEIMRQIARHEGPDTRTLIIAPLGVRSEFISDARTHLDTEIRFIRRTEEIDGPGQYVTNYESVRDGRLDVGQFTAVSLDEASVLRSFGSKTYQTFLTSFDEVPYRFVATATPSPNRYKELIHYAGFLGVMDTGAALTRWFQRDSTQANNLTLYGHKEAEFHLWLNTWACFLQSPADLGFSNDGYELPDLAVVYHEVDVDLADDTVERDGQGRLFRGGGSLGVQQAAKEKRDSLGGRVDAVMDVVDKHAAGVSIAGGLVSDQIIIWCLPPDAPITMADGTESPIAKVREGDQILSGYGVARRVNAQLSREHSGELVRIKVRGLCDPLELTPEHRLPTTTGWTTAGSLARGDYVLEPRIGLSDGGDYEAGWLCGVYAAQGNRVRGPRRTWNRIDLTVHQSKAATVAARIEAWSGGRAYRYGRDSSKAERIGISSRVVRDLVDQWVAGDSAVTKRLTALPTQREFARGVLDGWLEEDGWKSKASRIGQTSSKNLARQMLTIASGLGHSATMTTGENRPGPGARARGETPEVADWFRVGVSEYTGHYSQPQPAEEFIQRQVVGVERVPYAGPVFDLTVDVDHTFCASGVTVSNCDLNAEQAAVERALAVRGLTFSSVHGSLTDDEAERRLDEWRDRRTYALIGKPVMLGQGMNLQQCNTAVFVGLTHKFNSFIQACHRIQRYGQTRPCTAHLVHASSERDVVDTLRTKWVAHEELTNRMSDIIREHGLNADSIAAALTRSMGVERVESAGDGWLVANNDCVDETSRMDSESVDLIVTSIPFANHYEYTPAVEDFGHTDDNDHFWAQMDYLTPQLLRVLRPGRIYACHVKDRILFGGVTGAGIPTVSPFHAEAIFHARKHGFDYMGMVTVITDVVRENNQTYRLGWSEMAKDGTKMGVGSPEYVLLFHKPQTDRSKGYADVPVRKDKAVYTRARWQVDAHAFWRSDGDRPITPEELAALPIDQRSALFTAETLRRVYDYEQHIAAGEALDAKGALPSKFMSLAPGSWHPDVWHDVARMQTLNTEQSRRLQANHVCPLPFGIVDRLIERYSNPGELVYDPFGGLFTVVVRALKAGRAGRAVELNADYFRDGRRYVIAEAAKASMPSLFDLLDLEMAAAGEVA